MGVLLVIQTDRWFGGLVVSESQLVATTFEQHPRRDVFVVLLGLELTFPCIEVVAAQV